ncbi:hypothetical protein ACFL47_00485 [Candidatus Latescibacterota bacterium]
MKNRISIILILTIIAVLAVASGVEAQRRGGIQGGDILRHYLISNGPEGPIHGGESAVTDMILMDDGWVYGSTEATWGESACHLFRTDGEVSEHVINVTSKMSGQPKISDMAVGPGGELIGATNTYNEVYEEKKSYEGGHLFSYNPETKAFVDYGVMAEGQGINCVAVDTLHTRIYGITYPAGHLFAYDYGSKRITDFGEVMKPWRVKHLGRVSWRGVPKVLMLDDAGTVYYSTYVGIKGGCIFRLAYGDTEPTNTGAVVPTQMGMDDDPIYESTIVSAIKAIDGGFWCGTSVDGFLFKFYPSTSSIINKGKAFNYWNLKSMTYGGDGRLYMLGGRDYDNAWLLRYDTMTGSIESVGWPSHTTQMGVICRDKEGKILMAENLRNSYIWVYGPSGRLGIGGEAIIQKAGPGGEVRQP